MLQSMGSKTFGHDLAMNNNNKCESYLGKKLKKKKTTEKWHTHIMRSFEEVLDKGKVILTLVPINERTGTRCFFNFRNQCGSAEYK